MRHPEVNKAMNALVDAYGFARAGRYLERELAALGAESAANLAEDEAHELAEALLKHAPKGKEEV